MEELLASKLNLKQIENKEFSKIKAGMFHFDITQYEIEGIGNLSIMKAKGMAGMMKMDSIIITPLKKDAPLFSYDRIHAMGNDTLIVELYDTYVGQQRISDKLSLIQNDYDFLPKRDPGQHWYDSIKLKESLSFKGKKKDTPAFDEISKKYFEAYIEELQDAPEADLEAKRKKSIDYVDGLLEHGGPSTDVFVKKLGKEKTAELYHKVLFGTEA